MNKEYKYVNDKAIVSDEEGNQKVVEYYDNLNEVLRRENLLEEIESKITKLEEEKAQFRESEKYIPIVFPMVLLATFILVPILFKILGIGGELKMPIDTILGTMNKYTFFTGIISLVSLPLGALCELSFYNNYRSIKKEERAIDAEIDYLRKVLVSQKEFLEQLKKDKTKEKECENFKTIIVDDMDLLINLREHLGLYYKINYDIDKYYKYYQQGNLSDKLSNSYNENGIEMAKEILEEKGPVLVKKRK